MTTDDSTPRGGLPLASGYELNELRKEFEDFRDEYDLLAFQQQLNALADQMMAVRRMAAGNNMRITANFLLDLLETNLGAGGDAARTAQECTVVLSSRVAAYKAELRHSSDPEKLTLEWNRNIDVYMREHGFRVFVEE